MKWHLAVTATLVIGASELRSAHANQHLQEVERKMSQYEQEFQTCLKEGPPGFAVMFSFMKSMGNIFTLIKEIHCKGDFYLKMGELVYMGETMAEKIERYDRELQECKDAFLRPPEDDKKRQDRCRNEYNNKIRLFAPPDKRKRVAEQDKQKCLSSANRIKDKKKKQSEINSCNAAYQRATR